LRRAFRLLSLGSSTRAGDGSPPHVRAARQRCLPDGPGCRGWG
jgi:hypothetical protein